jgi:glutathione S-transferase
MSITLYSYWRSSAAYRVRIALNLKGLDYSIVPISLASGESQHREQSYRNKNPQMLVPFLEDGEVAIGQSMAMLEYLEETYPDVKLLPDLNLRVLQYIKSEFDSDPSAHWYGHWIHEGFQALEQLASDGPYVFGNTITLADALLVPQMYNARRFEVELTEYPKLVAAVNNCNKQDAFMRAAPEAQPDAIS